MLQVHNKNFKIILTYTYNIIYIEIRLTYDLVAPCGVRNVDSDYVYLGGVVTHH